MEDIESILLSMKEQALEATKNADADFYENYLADNAVAIVPFGVFDKKAIVEQMSSKNTSFKSAKIEDTKVMILTPDCGIVTYRATYQKEDQSSFEVFVTTVYAKINGSWKGVFYQQTAMVAPR